MTLTQAKLVENSEAELRRDFQLPEEDLEALDAFGCRWESVRIASVNWLFLHRVKVPSGFTLDEVTLAIRVVPNYPAAALDMAYVFPALKRQDGRPIPALSDFMLDGKLFQQWSRHYTNVNPWRVGVDGIGSHLRAVEEWWHREIGRV